MQSFTELYEVERRYEELAHRMSTPDAAANADEYARMMRDYKELNPPDRRIPPLHRPAAAGSGRKGNAGRRVGPGVCCYGTAGAVRNWPESGTERRESASAAHPKDADDEKSVILEIRAGAGGEEAALFAHSLWRMYTMYAARRGWQCETISENPTELGGVKEIVFSVRGAGRLQPPEIRERRPPCPARAADRDAGPHPHLHRHRGQSCPRPRRSSWRSTQNDLAH